MRARQVVGAVVIGATCLAAAAAGVVLWAPDLMGEGDADAVGPAVQGAVSAAPAPKRVRPDGLVMPAEKPCLAPPSGEGLAEDGIVGSQGLGYEQVAGAMRAFVSHTLRCVPEGTTPEGTITVDLTVACTGRVAAVEVVDDGGMPGAMVACVRETLAYAPFPSHDLPDGFTFTYPLKFSFQ